MTNLEALVHIEKLKKAYLNSQIKDIFVQYLANIYSNELYDRIISERIKHSKTKTYTAAGLYPYYCQYKDEEMNELNNTGVATKPYLRKEVLRRMFLLTFEDFLKKRRYGIDFKAYYRIPMNHVRFTLEYQNSGKLYRDYFGTAMK